MIVTTIITKYALEQSTTEKLNNQSKYLLLNTPDQTIAKK